MVFLLNAYLPERYKNTTESMRKVSLVGFGGTHQIIITRLHGLIYALAF